MESKTWEEGLDKAARLLASAEHVVALIGAGMSVESGSPPFRGPGGLWTKYGEPPMNGYQIFLEDPKKWWEERIAREQEGRRSELQEALEGAKPNPGHYALAELEKMGVLKCSITQNVDNLQFVAGCTKVAEIHGSTDKLRCIACNFRMARDEVSLEVLPPRCPQCGGIVKSDGVGFGEPIPSDTLAICQEQTAFSDCMLLLGTSGTVYPAAAFPQEVYRRGGSLIEVNPYETSLTPVCDVVLRGPTGEMLPQLVERLREAAKR